jgi:Holliday junction resolvase RusA-like endonuclease
MTRRDQRGDKRPIVARYHAFKDHVRLLKVAVPPSSAKITFHVPMPKSWSGRKKINMRGTGHMQRPDLDNFLKALLDACYGEDCVVWDLAGLTKIWDYEGAITVETP